MNLFGIKDTLSMEFGEDHIKVVVGKFYRMELDIKKHFTIQLPNSIYENGDILDFVRLAHIINHNLEINNVKTKNTHVLLDSDKIISREIIVPSTKEKNYEDFLEYHLSDYLSNP